jgi:hypothetical protein
MTVVQTEPLHTGLLLLATFVDREKFQKQRKQHEYQHHNEHQTDCQRLN